VDEQHEETFSHCLSFEEPMLSKSITEMIHFGRKTITLILKYNKICINYTQFSQKY